MVLASFHTFVVGLSILAQVAGQSMDPDEAKRRCDDLAASPWDDRKVGEGVDVERIVVKDALPVCKAAAEHQPAEPRHHDQYGCVLSAAGQHHEAFQQYLRAAMSGYVAAMTNAAVSYTSGRGVAQNDWKPSLDSEAAEAGHIVGIDPPGRDRCWPRGREGRGRSLAARSQIPRKPATLSPWQISPAWYVRGQGVKRRRLAVARDRKTERGNAIAMTELGGMYAGRRRKSQDERGDPLVSQSRRRRGRRRDDDARPRV